MALSWVDNNLLCKELYAPFILERDFLHISKASISMR